MLKPLLDSSRKTKRVLSILFDSVALFLSFYLAFCLRLGTFVPPIAKNEIIMILITWVLSISIFVRLGMYRAILRYISTKALATIALCACVSGLILTATSFFTHAFVPRSVPFIYVMLLLIFIGIPRLLVRSLVLLLSNHTRDTMVPVLIYGAGFTGHQLVTALNATHHRTVGFIDDDRRLLGRTLAGVKVYSPNQLKKIIQTHNVKKVLLALGNTTRSNRARVLSLLEPFAIEVQTVPALDDILSGKTAIEQTRAVEIEDLLGRDPVKPNPALMGACITGKVVMVTGAGGSIGSELCRQILKQHPKILVLFELNEYGLYAIEQELQTQLHSQQNGQQKTEIISLLGSVQYQDRLTSIMQAFEVQTVYHAAAYKHVPLVEHNIVEGVKNNVLGSWHCAEAAIRANVESFVLISTDKAVRPTNIMGASKRIAELVLQGLAQRQAKTRFTMVRFGNVLGSSGSVVPLFRQQIKNGGPITVTHPDIIRYFMTIPEAAELVIQTGSMGKGGDVFVLDMGEPVKIVDLAKRMVHLSGLKIRDKNNPDGDIEIEFSGLRPGEKLYEELLIGDNVAGTEHPRIMRAEENALSWIDTEDLIKKIKEACDSYKCDLVKEILVNAPAGYDSTKVLGDFVWERREFVRKKLALVRFEH
jgi:FlaA1/EpsC-like NDP-sugar epimerase